MNTSKIQSYSIPVLLIILLGMLLIPMSAFMLDLLFTFNIAFSMLIILAAITSKRAIDFSVFPTILLFATLLRLSLNVASTRVVLLNGHDGGAAAGQVIEAFGSVLIDGNYAVGFAIFAILIIINFAVITKGATRISEVSARFTLDALPGKQISIDADLSSGLLTKSEAIQKRQDLNTESEFFGAMDGASKFVRGDAVAGILILFVNLFAGILIGVLQFNLPLTEAIKTYSLLTIGDGLVAQIPALLLSIAAAIMVTRVSKDEELSNSFFSQITDSSKAINITAGVLLFLGLIPGMPKISFWTGSLFLFGYSYFFSNKNQKENSKIADKNKSLDASNEDSNIQETKEFSWEDIDDLEVIRVDLSFNALSVIKKDHNNFINKLTNLRKKLSNDLGFLIPAIKIKDNLNLSYNNYQIYINGINVFSGNIVRAKGSNNQIEILNNLGKNIIANAHDIFGYKEAEEILIKYKKQSSNTLQSNVFNNIPIATITNVFKGLLKEKVSIKDSRSIFQVIISSYHDNVKYEEILAKVRVLLGKFILQNIYHFDNPNNKEINAIYLDNEVIQYAKYLNTDYTKFRGVINYIKEELNNIINNNNNKLPIIIITPNETRAIFAEYLGNYINGVYVMSHAELPRDITVNIINKINIKVNELA